MSHRPFKTPNRVLLNRPSPIHVAVCQLFRGTPPMLVTWMRDDEVVLQMFRPYETPGRTRRPGE